MPPARTQLGAKITPNAQPREARTSELHRTQRSITPHGASLEVSMENTVVAVEKPAPMAEASPSR